MRGRTERQAKMLFGVTADDLVPAKHPIRKIRELVDGILDELSPTFAAMYAERGRPSIPPEHLLKGTLLMALYSIRSERQFCERLQSDLLFKWFLDLNIMDPGFDATAFSHNRERLLQHEVASAFRGDGGASTQAPAPLRRPFHRRRDPVAGLGLAQELPPSRRRGAAPGRGPEHAFGLPRPAAQQRDARLDDRPGGAAHAQRQSAGSPPQLQRTPAHREPQRPHRRCAPHARDGVRERDAALVLVAARHSVRGPRSGRTRPTTPPPSSPPCTSAGSRHTWRSTPGEGARSLTPSPARPGMPSASDGGSRSRSASAGARPSAQAGLRYLGVRSHQPGSDARRRVQPRPAGAPRGRGEEGGGISLLVGGVLGASMTRPSVHQQVGSAFCHVDDRQVTLKPPEYACPRWWRGGRDGFDQAIVHACGVAPRLSSPLSARAG